MAQYWLQIVAHFAVLINKVTISCENWAVWTQSIFPIRALHPRCWQRQPTTCRLPAWPCHLKRNPSLPDVPTVAESGFPGFEDYTWVGLFAPANLPPDLVARLNTVVNEALKTPKMRTQLATVGLDAKGGSPAEFKDYLNREVVKWGQVIKETGVEQQ